MGRRKYKVNDRVDFKFLGEPLTGTIKKIEENQKYSTADKVRYFVFDGKYTYPIRLENISRKVK